MPRQKNTKPTNIYWLYDMRPETVEWHGPEGRPFYAGKTVEAIAARLGGHRRKPHTPLLAQWMAECGEYVRIKVMEVVPADGDWVAREKYWIAEIRRAWPGGANISDGGSGSPGCIHSADVRERMGASRRGRPGRVHSASTRARMSVAQLGLTKPPFTVEHRAKIGNAHRGKSLSAEHRAKIGNAHRGKSLSAEHRAKISTARCGKKTGPRSAEAIAKTAAFHRGKKRTPEARLKMSIAQRGNKRCLGRKYSAETLARMSETARKIWATRRANALAKQQATDPQ